MDVQILNRRYRIDGELGRGGMGVVYRGCDLQLGRAVAIKLLPPSVAEDKKLLARFKNEITNTGKLDNPNMVKVYDMGEVDGAYYYVMELIDGHDLRTEINTRGQFEVDDACEILAQVAGALDYAHAQGILHRDIKPENILIESESNTVRIVDFGIAKAVGATRMTGGMIGTPEYISPEQARGEDADGRSDQYSLAVMAYEMLTGVAPFRTETPEPWAIVNMHISQNPEDPRKLQKNFPVKVAQALLKALSKRPDERFSTCTEFVEALQGKVDFSPIRYSKPKTTTVARKHQPFHLVALIIFMFAALSTGIFFVVRPSGTIRNGVGARPNIIPTSNSAKVISEAEVKSFLEGPWLSAWKTGQIGPYSQCYNNDSFVGHTYTSRNSYATLTFDAYLSQWLAEEKTQNAKLVNLQMRKKEDNHMVASFRFDRGTSGASNKRLTIEKRSDNSLAIIREDSAPGDLALDWLE